MTGYTLVDDPSTLPSGNYSVVDDVPAAPQPASAPEKMQPRTRLGQMVQQILSGTMAGPLVSAAPDLAMGVAQTGGSIAQMMARGGAGFGFSPQDVEGANAKIKDLYQSTAPESRPGADFVRGMVPGAAAALATRGASLPGFIGGAVTGAGYGAAGGALEPVYDAGNNADFWHKKAEQLGIGALEGGGTSAGIGMLGKVIAPALAKGVDALNASGIRTTLGQTLGGVAKSTEDRLAGFPVIGDLIKNQRLTGITDFQRAVYTKALEPLGPEAAAYAKKLPVGNEGIAKVGDYLSNSYEAALDRSVPNVVSPEFATNLANLRYLLPGDALRQKFSDIIQSTIQSKITPAGTLTPSVAKDIESSLGKYAQAYKGGSGDDYLFSSALKEAQAEVRALVAKNNPEIAPIIQATNDGWSTLVQMENAARAAGARKDGLFTPNQFLAAVQKGDNSVRKRAFSRGEIKNQEFAQDAAKVLPNEVPDSGTAGRNVMAAGLAGLFHEAITPGMMATGAVATLPYLPVVGAPLSMLMTARPQAMTTLGDLVKRAAPYLGAVGPAAISSRPE